LRGETRRRGLARPLYLGLGLVCCALGYIGLVLPVMPGTIFFILALNAFRRSNEHLEHWLLHRTAIGPTLRDWDEHGSIRPRTKKIAIAFLWLSILGSCASVFRNFRDPKTVGGLVLLLVAIASAVSWYIASRPDSRCQQAP